MVDQEPQTEHWTCAGVRVGSDHKRCVAWEDPHGEMYLYADRAKYILGAVYEIQVTRKDDGVYRRGHPVFGQHHGNVTDAKLREWRTAELEAEQYLARQARERKARGKADPLDDALAPLMEYARSARSESQRSALIADVIYRLNMAWFRR